MDIYSLSEKEYRLIRELVRERFGISLGEQKRNLIVGRLQKVLRAGGFSSFMDYYRYVVEEPTGRALLTLIDRISTNHTFFFREKAHFQFLLDTVLPRLTGELKRSGRKEIRIWCAGCSSGEEPYTLAMVLQEFFGASLADFDIGILATDISTTVLEKAVAGIYGSGQLSLVPPRYRQKYFAPVGDGVWSVRDSLKKMILFRRLNLMRQDYPFKGRFQAVFCRNVMIYFDEATRRELVSRFHRYIDPGGHLFIGHSESLGRSDSRFEFVRPAVYRKK